MCKSVDFRLETESLFGQNSGFKVLSHGKKKKAADKLRQKVKPKISQTL